VFDGILAEVEAGAKLLDVREPSEYADGHFKLAENYPLGLLQAGQMPDVPLDATIYVHCRSGARSAEAAAALQQAGFTNVINLGGLSDIEAKGGQLIQG
jgi:rhodanese-related sulfurtransferase